MADQAAPEPAAAHVAAKQTVDPWNVQGEIGEDGVAKAIDYNKLVDEFGTKKIDQELLDRFEKVTGRKPHIFMRRAIVFSHRDLESILDRYEKGEPFFLYTGRGPSSDSMHIGHSVPFEFTKWLQDVFDVPLVIMMTDDEKFLFKEGVTIDDVRGFTHENVKDIIAIGFDPRKTFIFSDYDFMGGAFYRNVSRVSKTITLNTARSTFGFNDSSNIGRVHFGAVQGATAFASTFPHIFGEDEKITNKIPCLIPCAIDQDPYFRLTRDSARSLGMAKPSLIHAKFLDALQGPGSKMSASIDSSAIFMKDTPSQIKNKINRYAFSGGRDTAEEQREKGGDTEKDVSYQYLRFFMEDDAELEAIREEYATGKMLTGEIKAKCIEYLQSYVKGFQERRAKVTDEVVKEFMTPRPLEWRGNPKAPMVVLTNKPEVDGVGGAANTPAQGGKLTKNQEKKLLKQKQIEEKKLQKQKEKEATASA